MSDMIEVERGFTVTGAGPDELHETAELVMAELVKLTSKEGPVLDAAVWADSSGSTQKVTIAVTVQAADLASGEEQALATMRAAIHAAGGATPARDGADNAMTLVDHTSRPEFVVG